MQNPNDLRDEPKKVVKKIQTATAVESVLCANTRRRLHREGCPLRHITVGDAMELNSINVNIDNIKRLEKALGV